MRRCALPRARWKRRRRRQRSSGARPISNGLSRCSTRLSRSVGRGSSPSSAPRAWERAGSPPRSRRACPTVRRCWRRGARRRAAAHSGRSSTRSDSSSVSTNRPMKALSARRSPLDASAWPTTPTALPRPLRHWSPGRLRGPPSSCSGRCDGFSRLSPKTARSSCSSTTCTGPSPRCWISSSTSPSGPGAGRCSSWHSPGRSYGNAGRHSSKQAGPPPP